MSYLPCFVVWTDKRIRELIVWSDKRIREVSRVFRSSVH
jgi:hypothetical protein